MKKPMHERLNARQLKADMVIYGDTQVTLAKFLGISTSTLSHKMGGTQCFTLEQMDKMRERYSMSPERFVDIFFHEDYPNGK